MQLQVLWLVWLLLVPLLQQLLLWLVLLLELQLLLVPCWQGAVGGLEDLQAADSAFLVAVAVEQLDSLAVADDLAVELVEELLAALSTDIGNGSPL